jgi:hypothetical protein
MEWIYFQTVLPLALIAFIVWWTWPKSDNSIDRGVDALDKPKDRESKDADG